MQIPCVYIPGPAPAVSVANNNKQILWKKVTFLFHSVTDSAKLFFNTNRSTNMTFVAKLFPDVQWDRRKVFNAKKKLRPKDVGQDNYLFKFIENTKIKADISNVIAKTAVTVLFWPSCPVVIWVVLNWSPVLAVPFCMPSSAFPFWMSCSGRFVLSCSGGPILAILFWLSAPFCHALAV